MTKGVLQFLNTDAVAKQLKDSARLAAVAVKDIENEFVELMSELSSIDTLQTPPKEGAFAPRLKVIRGVST